MDPSQVSQSDLKNFIDTVKESLQENHLTNSEKKKIKKLPLNDPFRSLITTLDAASGSQGLQNAAQVLNNMGNQLTPQLQNVKNAQKSLQQTQQQTTSPQVQSNTSTPSPSVVANQLNKTH